MAHCNIKFSEIGLDDLVGDKSVVLMSEFVQLCTRNPPIGRHTKHPFLAATLQNLLSGAMRKLQAKFASQTANFPPLFPDEMIQSWRRKLKDNFNQTMMQDEDESDMFSFANSPMGNLNWSVFLCLCTQHILTASLPQNQTSMRHFRWQMQCGHLRREKILRTENVRSGNPTLTFCAFM